jgi:hypothetical protein
MSIYMVVEYSITLRWRDEAEVHRVVEDYIVSARHDEQAVHRSGGIL